jgi:hypothetical protein
MVVRAALTEATSATPGLRTISMAIPQARVLNVATRELTGSYAFVGSAGSEGEVTDAVSGNRLVWPRGSTSASAAVMSRTPASGSGRCPERHRLLGRCDGQAVERAALLVARFN